jgi:hypothetical protein
VACQYLLEKYVFFLEMNDHLDLGDR